MNDTLIQLYRRRTALKDIAEIIQENQDGNARLVIMVNDGQYRAVTLPREEIAALIDMQLSVTDRQIRQLNDDNGGGETPTQGTGTTDIPDGYVTREKLSQDVQSSLGKADTSVQSLDGYATELYVREYVEERTQGLSGGSVTYDHLDEDLQGAYDMAANTDTVEMEVTYEDDTTATYQVLILKRTQQQEQ